jgi:hypothetical protein
MIALPVGDRSVGNERAGFRSVKDFEPTVGCLMPLAKPDQGSDDAPIRSIFWGFGLREMHHRANQVSQADRSILLQVLQFTELAAENQHFLSTAVPSRIEGALHGIQSIFSD